MVAAYINRVNRVTGSDHFIQQLFTDLLVANKFKFVSTCSNYVNPNRLAYPMLLNWFLGKWRIQDYSKASRTLLLVNNGMSSIIHLLTSFIIYRYYSVSCSLPLFLVLSGALFVTTVFSFNTKNAKSTGLSARGIGLWLGQLYTLLLLVSVIGNTWWYVLPAALAGMLIILSSTFATQFILFGSPVLSLLMFDVKPTVAVVVSFGLFLLLFPSFSKEYLKGQFTHKKMYSRYIASVFILKQRPSIWMDWINEIPKRMHWLLADYPKNKKQLEYISGNALWILVFQMPAYLLTIAVWPLIAELSTTGYVLWSFALSPFILFVATSFRATRFLGEPERYIEFGLIPAAILALFTFNIWVIGSLVIVQLALISIELINFTRGARKQNSDADSILEVRNHLKRLADSESVRLMVPNTAARRKLRSVYYKQYDWSFFNESSDGYVAQDIFAGEYKHFHYQVVPELIRKYELNFLFVTSKAELDQMTESEMELNSEHESSAGTLYRINWR